MRSPEVPRDQTPPGGPCLPPILTEFAGLASWPRCPGAPSFLATLYAIGMLSIHLGFVRLRSGNVVTTFRLPHFGLSLQFVLSGSTTPARSHFGSTRTLNHSKVTSRVGKFGKWSPLEPYNRLLRSEISSGHLFLRCPVLLSGISASIADVSVTKTVPGKPSTS